MKLPSTLPVGHRAFLEAAVQTLKRDGRIVGVAAGGSFATDTMDEHSDLDLILAIDPKHTLEVMQERPMIAGRLGALLAAFTGEHVGEPRLLICLYGPPLLHVDLKFVDLNELAPRIESPVVLWERNAEMSFALAQTAPTPLSVDDDWIEDRFWVWMAELRSMRAPHGIGQGLGYLAFALALRNAPGDLEQAQAHARLAWSELRGERHSEWLVPAIAFAFARNGRSEDASRLIGYSDAVWASEGFAARPSDTKVRDQTLNLSHGVLGAQRMAELMAEGAALNEDQAVALAFGIER